MRPTVLHFPPPATGISRIDRRAPDVKPPGQRRWREVEGQTATVQGPVFDSDREIGTLRTQRRGRAGAGRARNGTPPDRASDDAADHVVAATRSCACRPARRRAGRRTCSRRRRRSRRGSRAPPLRKMIRSPGRPALGDRLAVPLLRVGLVRQLAAGACGRRTGEAGAVEGRRAAAPNVRVACAAGFGHRAPWPTVPDRSTRRRPVPSTATVGPCAGVTRTPCGRGAGRRHALRWPSRPATLTPPVLGSRPPPVAATRPW